MTSTDQWNRVMQAEDQQRSAKGLERAAVVLAEARSEPATQRRRLSADAGEFVKVLRTAASLQIGSEYGTGDVRTAVMDGLVAIVRLAEYADVDFRDCLHEALWHYGCEVIDGGAGVPVPRELIARSDELSRVLSERGFRTTPEEVTAVAGRLQRAKVLELDDRELSLLEALREGLRALCNEPPTKLPSRRRQGKKLVDRTQWHASMLDEGHGDE